ncbi:DNA polymerase IV [Monosporozyma unispora]|nr:hypothetical protein C6P44_003542 [Kazachstania unispora]
MLFENTKFLILPNLNASSTQFRVNLIEDNGGHIIHSLDEIDENTVILILDSFVNDKKDGITEFLMFQKESVHNLDIVFDDIIENHLPCFKLSTISKWLSKKIVPKDDWDESIKFKDEEEEHSNIEQLIEGSPFSQSPERNDEEESSTDEADTDVSSTNHTDFDSYMKETSTELPTGVNQKYINLDSSANDNRLLIDTLKNLSKKYKVKGDTFRARGYDLAKSSIEKCNFKITSGKQAQRELPNIGPSIGKKIQIILDIGTLPGVEVVTNIEQTLSYFQNCHGIGPFTAKKWSTLRMNNFNDILLKMPEEFISEWPSLYGWEYYEDWSKRISRRESEAHLAKVKKHLHQVDPKCSVEIQGSYNRGKESSGDIDLLFYKEDCDDMDEISSILQQLVIKLYEDEYIKCILQLNPTLYDIYVDNVKDVFKRCHLKFPGKNSIVTSKSIRKYYLGVTLKRSDFKLTPQEINTALTENTINKLRPGDEFMSLSVTKPNANPCRRLDFFSCKWSQLGAGRLQWTGSAEFNRWIRLRATGMGYKLSQHGLFKGEELIESFDERKIFKVLKVPCIGYDEREQGLWEKRVANIDD